jgi:tRNA(Arg) A34 adenosine deaminase TadA
VRPVDLSEIPTSAHEQAMRLAIAEARGNPAFPFGAVILRAADRHGLLSAANRSSPAGRGRSDNSGRENTAAR